MNERIQELMDQCEEEYSTQNYPCWDMEKFARLIVKECVNKQLSLAANYEATAEGYEPAFPEFVEGTVYGLKEGAELIKQHFGIE